MVAAGGLEDSWARIYNKFRHPGVVGEEKILQVAVSPGGQGEGVQNGRRPSLYAAAPAR